MGDAAADDLEQRVTTAYSDYEAASSRFRQASIALGNAQAVYTKANEEANEAMGRYRNAVNALLEWRRAAKEALP